MAKGTWRRGLKNYLKEPKQIPLTCLTLYYIIVNMSRKNINIQTLITEPMYFQLKDIQEDYGDMSMSALIRFIITDWMRQQKIN